MLNYADEMNASYQYFISNAPEVENASLDKSKPMVEQLVVCKCMKQYRVFVNGRTPIADINMDGIQCPNCGGDAKDYLTISGHSAGCFNATVRRQ